MTTARTAAVRRQPSVWPVVVAIGAAAVLWAVSLQKEGYATRYPAVPIAFAAFLGIQLLVPRVRWNSDRVLGPGNVAALLFFLQLVVIPTLFVVSGPILGTLRFRPSDNYINHALLLQVGAYACYTVGYVAWAKPARPKPFLLEPRFTTGVAFYFIAFGAVGVALAFGSMGALVAYFSGQATILTDPEPTTLSSFAAQFLRPFLAYGVIVLWALRVARRQPGARLQPMEAGLIVVAIAASAIYDYNRASAAIPLLALVTAYSRFGRRLSPIRIVALLAVVAFAGFLFGGYRDIYQGTRGGAISESAAGLDHPRPTFADYLQSYGNGPQFWAVIVQEVDRTGTRQSDSVISSAMYPVPELGKAFRNDSAPVEYNALIYGEPEIIDQILGFGAELYWNYGSAGIAIGYFLLGLAVRRFDDGLEAAPDALAAYNWSYCGTWVALMVINSISILSQIVVYFFWPIFAMSAIGYLARSHLLARSNPVEALP
ncbi:hypothetical protein FZI85_09065 [Mycobacterium sp. CBMA293]|uniref:hypothetical protein n=3 Tax=Mycolicibacterium TaxID=1866885 RepID=UPI0012DEFD9F|nr:MULTISPECIES: hypothetical protein [unclassified Mycolicibacterium]MUL46258.1 hypothetical protein [Mycolicibacterium sp. CBMA 360]MUL58691.1 hypothetical protein [Mycolicibacterium sp. CBMA 335]MUL69085.1 hypothetical protein [Mycolicibacterium sp. CBMA 311]MUL97261.1 hypothetical protein [Mycolicibacterium sp. CBMA 230]MUM05061.1 hypothetical protein [Mycolicibacterium sp. CBMA 213]